MKSSYLEQIKDILEDSELHSWDSLDIFQTKDIFYFFQYPLHFIEYFGEREWRIFEKMYLRYKIKGKMNIPTRWMTLLLDHIKGKKVLDLGSSLGAELYFINKNLNPKYILGIENSPPAIKLAKLAFEMHNMKNVNILEWNLIENLDTLAIEDKDFEVTILSGSLFSFAFRDHLDFVNSYMTKLAEFISRVTTSYFYFIGVDKSHLSPIQTYFSDKVINILDVKRTRTVREFVNKRLLESEYDTNRNEFYGYITL